MLVALQYYPIMKPQKNNFVYHLKKSFFKLSIVLVVLLNSLVISVFSNPTQKAYAANSYASKLAGIDDPGLETENEFGIWVDRSKIYLYFSSEPLEENRRHSFAAPVDGLNDQAYTYTNDCNSLLANPSNPGIGKLATCAGGAPKDVVLYNQDNSRIDGYSYSDDRGDVVEMPRYAKKIEGCGLTDLGTDLSVTYGGNANENPGVFIKDGSEFKLEGSDSTVVYDYNSRGGNPVATARQKKTSDCDGILRRAPGSLGPLGIAATGGSDATLSYAGGQAGGRGINLLKGYSQETVQDAVSDKITDYNSKRERLRLLTEYFNANPDSVTDGLFKCADGTGRPRDQAALTRYLVNNYDPAQGTGFDPFVDCVIRELGDDADFSSRLDYEYTGDFEDNLIADTEGNCEGGIPIVGELACLMLQAVYDALFAGFEAVIEYFSSPPDMFEEQNSTLEKSINNLKNIANIIFVFAFLFVVFQYMTNINVVDAYFVKKFIPRLVIAVVLVQASFFIVSELNYIFFDLGKSIQTIVFQGTSPSELAVTNGAATLALAYAFVLGPAMVGILLFIGIILLLVLLVTIIVLSIRYILLIVLAILAPLAFAALAIPQLEGMAKKWFTMYIKLLMMYPIIMFFLAASAVVAGAISGGGVLMQILSLMAAFIPFIILPFTFKFAGGIMGTVAAKMGNLAKKGAKMGINQGKKAYEKSDYKMGKDYAKEQDRKRKQGDAQARKREQILAGGGGRRGRRMMADPRARAELEAERAQHNLGEQASQERLRKIQQSAETQRIAEEQRNIAAHIRGGGFYEDRNGRHHTNERDASLAYLTDQAARNASLGTTEGMDNANIAMGQLLANGGDTPFVGELRDSLGGDSRAWDALRSANYTPLAAVRADLAAASRPGSTDDFFSVASTVEKQAGQKREAWHTAAQADAIRAMAAYNDVENSGGGNAGKLANKDQVIASVAQSINRNHAQVGNASLTDLQKAHDSLRARHEELTNTPGADASVVAATADALRVIQNEVASR